MRVSEIEIIGYRSVKELRLKLGDVNMLVGPNGSGKSNIYKAIHLVAAAAMGNFARQIVEEGGIRSVLWAGKRSKNEEHKVELSLKLEELSYKLEFGRIPLSDRVGGGLEIFSGDPDIKYEEVRFLAARKPLMLLERKRGAVVARNASGEMEDYPAPVAGSQSVLSELREAHNYPEISTLRNLLTSWRFYHDFRTDASSPIRKPQLGTFTPILSHDGRDLGSALATIAAVGNGVQLNQAIDRAFPGSSLSIDCDEDDQINLHLTTPGLLRPLTIREFSDGTLQYLCLLAALLTPRPAPLMVLNEPETSIHPDLMEPLSELIMAASRESQIIVTTHSIELANFIKDKSGVKPIQLEKVDESTRIIGASRLVAYSADEDS